MPKQVIEPEVRKSASQAAPAKRGRPSKDRSAVIGRTILDIATELFLSEGFNGVSMEVVAKQAGIPKSTLYKRYKDKRVLLGAVIDERVAAWGDESSQYNWMLTNDLAQRLKQYAAWMIAWARNPEVRAMAALAAAAWSGSSDETIRRDTIGYTRMMVLIEQDIRELSPAAGIAKSDPSRVATALMAMVLGWIHLHEAADDEKGAAAFVDGAVDMLFRGTAAW